LFACPTTSSAYNYFFKENRAILLSERDDKIKLAKELGRVSDDIESGYGFFGTMVRRRVSCLFIIKTGAGNQFSCAELIALVPLPLSFSCQAKIIAKKWKEISKDALEGYKMKAEVDSKRYRDEMEHYNLRKRMTAKLAGSSKKGKKAKAKDLIKKGKAPGKTSAAMTVTKPSSKTPVVIEDARALAGVDTASTEGPVNLAASQARMMRLGQPILPHADIMDGLAGGDAGRGMGMLPPRSAAAFQPNQLLGLSPQQQQQQLDFEMQLALVHQQRQLDAMALVSQASRPALLGGLPSNFGFSHMGGLTGGLSPQLLYNPATLPAMQFSGTVQPAGAVDLSFASRMNAYAQQEQEAALLRHQMLVSAGVSSGAPLDAGFTDLLVQLRMQQQDERLRNQALSLGQGRWYQN
jgi:hypothetical protein